MPRTGALRALLATIAEGEFRATSSHEALLAMKKALLVVLGLAIGLVIYSAIETRSIKISSHRVSSDKLSFSEEPFRIAFLSDLHVGQFTPISMIERSAQMVAEIEPDLLILGGDYVYHYEGNYRDIFAAFEAVVPSQNRFAVSGNHDHWEDYEGIMAALEQGGWNLLENGSQLIHGHVGPMELAGVPDLWLASFSDIAILDRDPEQFRILVSHNPDYLVASQGSYDLGLAGHTHGGQVTLFGLWAPMLPIEHKDELWRGREELGESTAIVSNGIGVSVLPFRLFAPPEITVVEIYGLGN